MALGKRAKTAIDRAAAKLPSNPMQRRDIDLLRSLSEAGLHCTSCGVCQNVCSVNALRMTPDALGFPVPQIDAEACVRCRKCLKVCPPLSFDRVNHGEPECYAAIGSHDVAMKSSSGGVFYILAKRFIASGGFVVGARFDEDFHSVSLDIASTMEELERFRGSKYVQSIAGDVYSRVKRLLEGGNKVLFTGMPCQVAAMRSLVGGSYKNLYLIDIFCHSSPSPAMYKQYLDELADGRVVTNVEFRPKEYSWEALGIKTSFQDGSYHMTIDHSDPYLLGFHKSLFCKDSCVDCLFQEVPRQGDLTIGDFWGVDKLFPAIDYSQGVSVVFSNNENGHKLLSLLSEEAVMVNAPVSFVRSHNRMSRKRRHHLARRRFFEELLPSMSFADAVNMALKWRFDVAISGGWCVRNYGGALTYYALYSVCRELGYHPIMVESHTLPPQATPSPKVFRKSPYPFYNVSRIHKNLDEMRELNNRVWNFMVGSDQIWNHSLRGWGMSQAGPAYCLAYVEPWRKRIAYATSFGAVNYKGTPEEKTEFAKQLQQFDYVSVREDAGVRICRDEFHVAATRQVDPVFLCDKGVYSVLADRSECVLAKPTAVFYLIWPDSLGATQEMIASIASNKGLDYLAIGDAGAAEARSKKTGYPYRKDFSAEDWLRCMREAAIVVSDSFHAVCFSVVFRRDFVFVKSPYASITAGLDRIYSLLESIGLENRIVEGLENVTHSEAWNTAINYDAVYRKLEPQIDDGLQWLKNAIESPKEFK